MKYAIFTEVSIFVECNCLTDTITMMVTTMMHSDDDRNATKKLLSLGQVVDMMLPEPSVLGD